VPGISINGDRGAIHQLVTLAQVERVGETCQVLAVEYGLRTHIEGFRILR
jgi:hypothetical protein